TLRHYLLPSLPALALLTGPTVVALLAASPPAADRRTALVRAAGALLIGGAALATGRWFLGGGWQLLSTSDRSTLEAVLPLVGGRGRASPAGPAVVGAGDRVRALGAGQHPRGPAPPRVRRIRHRRRGLIIPGGGGGAVTAGGPRYISGRDRTREWNAR